MANEMSFKELLEHINNEHTDGRANCSIGLFVVEHSDETQKEIENFIVKKPIVSISSFAENNEWYYNVGFYFKSYNDADYKQMWKFLCRFVDKTKNEALRIEDGEVLEKITVLSISIIPDKFKGKYFVNVHMPFAETISRSEDAYDGTANISLICSEESLQALLSDDDIIDPRSIELEVESELLSES